MNRKLIAIFTALLLSASLFACGGETETEESTSTTTINIETDTESNGTDETDAQTNEGESNEESESETTPASQIGDPGEYEYDERDEKVYVNNPDSEVTLRSADYKALGTVKHGTELTRVGLSQDADNYWSKVTYGSGTYYIASKFVTTVQNPDEGFVEVSKTVRINDATGSLKIRNIPTMDGSAVIGYAEAANDIKVIAENTTTGWYKIEFVAADGKTMTGYIASDAKYFEGEATTSEANLFKDDYISLSYPKSWVASEDGSVVLDSATGDGFNVIYDNYSEEYAVYENITKESFEKEVLPTFTAIGCELSDYDVRVEKKDGVNVSTLSYTNKMGDYVVYQSQFIFKVGSDKICIITVSEVDKATTIAEDLYATLVIAG